MAERKDMMLMIAAADLTAVQLMQLHDLYTLKRLEAEQGGLTQLSARLGRYVRTVQEELARRGMLEHFGKIKLLEIELLEAQLRRNKVVA